MDGTARYGPYLRAENVGLVEGHEGGVHSHGHLHGQVLRHHRRQNDDALEEELWNGQTEREGREVAGVHRREESKDWTRSHRGMEIATQSTTSADTYT